MKNFKGLSLESDIAFSQIAAMIRVGLILSVIDMKEKTDLSDCVLHQAMKYAEAAHNAVRENEK